MTYIVLIIYTTIMACIIFITCITLIMCVIFITCINLLILKYKQFKTITNSSQASIILTDI